MAADSGLTGACRDNPETWPASPKLPGLLQQTLAMGSSWCSLKREWGSFNSCLTLSWFSNDWIPKPFLAIKKPKFIENNRICLDSSTPYHNNEMCEHGYSEDLL